MAAQGLRLRHCLLRRCDVPDDGVQSRRDRPRDLLMHALSLFDRREVRSFVFVQIRPPLAARSESRPAGPPQSAATILPEIARTRDSNGDELGICPMAKQGGL